MSEKIGAGHASAMFRAGAKELAQALPAFPGHSVQPVEEPGIFGNVTQLEVNKEKGVTTAYEQLLQERAAQAHERPEPAPEQGLEPES